MSPLQTEVNGKEKEFPVLAFPERCTGCRTCQVRCSFRNLGEFNPFKSYLKITRDHGKRTTAIIFTDDCLACGYCARFCPYEALVLRKKVQDEVKQSG